MADKAVAELSAASALAGTEKFYADDGANDVYVTPAQIATYVKTTGADLTKADDTNVTLTLGGTAAGALLKAVSLTLGWLGTLATSRGGFGADVSASSGVPVFSTGTASFKSLTGVDATVVSGTAGTNGNLASWNVDGDAVDSSYAAIDEDSMASNSATKLPTQQSVKAYVDTGLSAKQASDAFLTALAALGTAADKLLYTTGVDTAAETALTSFMRTLLDDADVATALATLTARGQGKETIWIPASAMWARTTNGPGAASRELTTGGDIMIKGWAFDTTTEEGVQFYIAFPKSWNKSTITFKAFWTNVNGLTTETVSWGLSMGAYTDDDPIDSTDLGTEVRVSDTWLAANDLHVTAESAAVTIGNTPIDSDLCIGQIVRSVSNDNMTGDAELLGIKIYFTTNAATDA